MSLCRDVDSQRAEAGRYKEKRWNKNRYSEYRTTTIIWYFVSFTLRVSCVCVYMARSDRRRIQSEAEDFTVIAHARLWGGGKTVSAHNERERNNINIEFHFNSQWYTTRRLSTVGCTGLCETFFRHFQIFAWIFFNQRKVRLNVVLESIYLCTYL